MYLKRLIWALTGLILFSACKNQDRETPSLPAKEGAEKPATDADPVFGDVAAIIDGGTEGASTGYTVPLGGETPKTPTSAPYAFETLIPQIACVQMQLGADGLKVSCTAKNSGGDPFSVGSEPVEVKWVFSHPVLKEVVPTIAMVGDATAPASAASFTFVGLKGPMLYYLVDTGNFAMMLTYSKDMSQTKMVPYDTLAMKGDGCGAQNTISLRIEIGRFRLVDPGYVLRIFGGSGTALFLDRNAAVTTDGDSFSYIAPYTGKITDKGNGGTAIVFKGSSYTASGTPKAVMADKGALIQAPADKIFTFRTPLSYCP